MNSSITVCGESVLLHPIIDLAVKAGDAILTIYEKPTENWGMQSKSDDSPLTKADLAANAVICERLKSLHSFPIMSEETKAPSYDERSAWSAYWCVDPLDGTKEFIKRNGEFTVNIALMQAVDDSNPAYGARPVLGVVYAPVLKKIYFAASGVGAYMKTLESDAAEIKCLEFSESDENLVLVCSRSHLDERTQKYLDGFKNATTKSMGSSLKFMLVASGEAHIYPRMAPTMEWDTAASQIVVEEAGGRVLHADTNKPLRYNKEELRNPYFYVFGKMTV
ncbi:3'(2'),5'-bisphosphate nucleotidase CysQ [Gracilariopsis chorda]|uniref:3'(2'),5'-bisphosphate nucleotidase 1 n=1 Tax=Gracilariopsis chorda TaxID=448386 RepID=A0A2V3IYA9_9FLOR|nr:3'(2'),5'-bisphosphate nucleotidase CysQ [Gracilariopsis chorda]|eukprot:PXF46120.1 3'(2'),5'-bisphosphate nucleotidase CysQ [Gracilariopsis chorda]